MFFLKYVSFWTKWPNLRSILQKEPFMKAYRVEKTIAANGALTLQALPFEEGDEVEVIILPSKSKKASVPASPVRGKVIAYVDPTEPVGQDDWEALK